MQNMCLSLCMIWSENMLTVSFRTVATVEGNDSVLIVACRYTIVVYFDYIMFRTRRINIIIKQHSLDDAFCRIVMWL